MARARLCNSSLLSSFSPPPHLEDGKKRARKKNPTTALASSSFPSSFPPATSVSARDCLVMLLSGGSRPFLLAPQPWLPWIHFLKKELGARE